MRIAVIGSGLIGSRHVELVSRYAGCSLVAVCDTDASREVVAVEHDVPFYRDLEELFAQEDLEAAIISTPNGSHASIAVACAEQSVHVLIEKPISDSMAEANVISRLADEGRIQVLVGHHRRHNPLIARSRAIVHAGALGRLVGISVLWALLKPGDYFREGWRRTRPGGGPTVINLVHELDSLRFICGEMTQVFAHTSSAIRGFEVEDTLSITISFASGALGTVLASDVTAAPWSYEATTGENLSYFHAEENCYFFLGTEGSLAFPRMELWGYGNAEQASWQHPMEKSVDSVVLSDPLETQLEHFCQVVRGKEAPIVDAEDATRSLSAALAVLESSQRGSPVSLPSSTPSTG